MTDLPHDTDKERRTSGHWRSLSFRLGLALTIALLPLALLAAFLAMTNTRNIRDAEILIAEKQFLSVAKTVDTIFDQQFLILQAMLPRRGDPRTDCGDGMIEAAGADAVLQAVMRIDSDGRMVCASDAAPRLTSAQASEFAAQVRTARNALIWPGGELVFLISRGVTGNDDTLIATAPATTIAARIDSAAGTQHAGFAVSLSGRRLAGGLDGVAPPGSKLAIDRLELQGGRIIVAAGPLEYGLGLVVHAPAAPPGAFGAAPVLLPAVLLAAALLIAWLAILRLVVAPLRRMAAGVRIYGSGNVETRLADSAGTTSDMRAFAEAFDDMADDASRARDVTAGALAAQQRMMREVHHRVKNNLQIIASLISIQARAATGTTALRAYAGLQMRVNALALVHRWLFEDSATQGLDFGALAHDLCSGLQQSVAETEHIELAIVTRIDRLYVSQDAAVPLAFLITEIVAASGRLLSCGGGRGAPMTVTIEISQGETGALGIAAPVFCGTDTLIASNTGPSGRIVQGMVRQLRGSIGHDPVEGNYTIRFPILARN